VQLTIYTPDTRGHDKKQARVNKATCSPFGRDDCVATPHLAPLHLPRSRGMTARLTGTSHVPRKTCRRVPQIRGKQRKRSHLILTSSVSLPRCRCSPLLARRCVAVLRVARRQKNRESSACESIARLRAGSCVRFFLFFFRNLVVTAGRLR
jgi:hypothetical protein